MSDELLTQATRALRETTGGEDAAARFTRARVMASVHQSRHKRSLRAAILLPLAAILVGSTAWGAASGQLPAVLRAVGQVLVGAPQVQPTTPARTVAPPATPSSTAVGPRPLPFAPAALEAEPEDADTEPLAVMSAPPPPSASAPPKAQRPLVDPEGSAAYAAYRRGHTAHFGSQDPAAALVAWDEYLRLAPGGRFALEASYNRALCLVRLGRRAEALAALEPFATGRYGGYRRREAAELRSALGGEPLIQRTLP